MSFVLDMPPSINSLYVKRRGGAVALSKDALAYREHVKKEVAKGIVEVSKVLRDGSIGSPEIYGIEVDCFFEKLENPEWFKKAVFSRGERVGQLKVKLRYKKVDADNRVKFLQDWITKCVGMEDDAIVFDVHVRKRDVSLSEHYHQMAGRPHVVVRLFEVPRGEYLPDPQKGAE